MVQNFKFVSFSASLYRFKSQIKCGYDYVVHALREAVIYRQLKFPYIDRILNQWLKDGFSLEDLNAGKRNAK